MELTAKFSILCDSTINNENTKTMRTAKQPPEVFCKKGVFRNFAKFTGKCLCQSLFFNRVAGLVSLRIQSECKKTRTRKNSVLGQFSRSVSSQ